jgi:hypothetical protein
VERVRQAGRANSSAQRPRMTHEHTSAGALYFPAHALTRPPEPIS